MTHDNNGFPDMSAIHLDGEDAGAVPDYDCCWIHEKLTALLWLYLSFKEEEVGVSGVEPRVVGGMARSSMLRISIHDWQ